ncbi:hypothetical protein C4D60_Mb07t09390 [Musa balbisiana]|uniref:Kinesin-like protein n=1 Tax=Musa balbisiana TaxID=52838 RepID=A0A4S8JEA4_MUSBA|nr:hypothetical protein C4D60_Mb07t09390 [Musa balbisiana]
MAYVHAVAPLVNDVLEGFNCTVFAYGQTGTGKTYTMEGSTKPKGQHLSVDAGVIPRAVRHIFDTLEGRKADYSMKVTFLELYNEEITDLLATEEQTRLAEDRQRKQISLMEDGKGGAVIRGLEEVAVYSVDEIYSLLERGSAKRRTADTLLNKQSSRSHSVFSITIHVKEATIGNDELIKCGRLNLVDLAGSENISRSGAREGRAREAGEVNKSLLTLGRVITSLAEHSSHIPYRDSKLTRLLRESLGGRAKTCIIATISPSAHSLEETLNTLDYACRAKNIKNKPEANKKFSKSVLLKDLFLEIEKLKQDVRAAREKNGIYIPQERFLQDEAEKKATHEKLDVLEFDLDHARKQADRFQELYHAEQERNLDLESKLKECKTNLEENKKAYLELQEILMRSNLMLKEREYIISNLLDSERQSQIEAKNHGLVVDFGSELDQSLQTLHRMVIGSICENHESLKSMEEYVSSFVAAKCEAAKCLDLKHERLKSIYSSGILHMKELAGALQHKAFSDLEETRSTMFAQMIAVENFLVTVASEAEQVLHDIQISLSEQKDLLDFFVQQQATGLQRNLVSTEAISKTTIHFFHELQRQVSKLLKNLEHDQLEKSRRLAAFEKNFVDLSAREDKAAFEKISLIFTNLMKLKMQMVSEVLGNVNDTNAEDSRRQQVEVANMQLTSDNAKKSWINYIQRVESQVRDDAASIMKIRTTMDNVFRNCSIKVGQSLHHWKNIQSTIDHMHKDSTAEVDCFVVSRNQEMKNIFEEFTSVVSENNVQFDSETSDLQAAAKMSLVLDHEVMERIESTSTRCFDHLKGLQDTHSENVKDIRSLADKCLLTEYTVDNPTSLTPTKRSLNVPSLASIEELRTQLEDPIKHDRRDSKLREAEEKQHVCVPMPTPRSPLTPINSL